MYKSGPIAELETRDKRDLNWIENEKNIEIY